METKKEYWTISDACIGSVVVEYKEKENNVFLEKVTVYDRKQNLLPDSETKMLYTACGLIAKIFAERMKTLVLAPRC